MKYRELRQLIDSETLRLDHIHSQEMVCKAGCSGCCMEFSVFPVEFFSVLEEIKGRNLSINRNALEGECVFLVDGLCTIYNSRPVICRTHGLPMMAMGEESWELSYCELNFTGGQTEFNAENTYPHDRFNSELYLINRAFIMNILGRQFSERDLVPLKELVKEAGL